MGMGFLGRYFKVYQGLLFDKKNRPQKSIGYLSALNNIFRQIIIFPNNDFVCTDFPSLYTYKVDFHARVCHSL